MSMTTTASATATSTSFSFQSASSAQPLPPPAAPPAPPPPAPPSALQKAENSLKAAMHSAHLAIGSKAIPPSTPTEPHVEEITEVVANLWDPFGRPRELLDLAQIPLHACQTITGRKVSNLFISLATPPGSSRAIIYRVNLELLDQDQLHVCYSMRNPLGLRQHTIISIFEKAVFPPETTLNALFRYRRIFIQGEEFVLCSFPKTDGNVDHLKRAAAFRNLEVRANVVHRTFLTRSIVEVPAQDNVLVLVDQNTPQDMPLGDAIRPTADGALDKVFSRPQIEEFELIQQLIHCFKAFRVTAVNADDTKRASNMTPHVTCCPHDMYPSKAHAQPLQNGFKDTGKSTT